MRYIFHILTAVLCFVLSSTSGSYAQTDTTEFVSYDLIYLTKGGVLKGEILAFDEQEGGVVFKDQFGRKYSFAREDYDYFKEDQIYPLKKKAKEIRPRKNSGFGFDLGLSAALLDLQHDFTPDQYYLNGVDALGEIAVSMKLVAGKYVNEQNYVGLTTELALFSQSKNYLNIGGRYVYQYDGRKRNIAFYNPVELKFQTMQVSSSFQVNDTAWDIGGYSYPSDQDVDMTLNSVSVEVGQGLSFIMNNQKSISLEVSFVKQFVLSNKFVGLKDPEPDSEFGVNGVKLTILYRR